MSGWRWLLLAVVAVAVVGGAALAYGEAAGESVPVPEPSAKALRYYRSGNVLWAASNAWGLLVPAVLLLTGFSARLRRTAERLVGRRLGLLVAAYFVLFAAVSFVVDLPLAYYATYVRPHAYGLSNQTFGKWAGDAAKGLVVGMILGALTLWIPYLLLKKSPRRWWVYTGLLSAPFFVLLLLVSPVWIDPLFNEFGPMKDKALEGRILALAERAGIEGGRVYEVDKSVDTETVNAYVAGILDTKRIVLWDTIIRKLDERELMFVMGHEMAHFVLGHTLRLVALLTGLVFVGLFVVQRSARALIARHQERFGFTDLADPASLPLILLLFNATFLVVTPAALAFTRYNEREADRFGLEITRDNHAAATAFVKLQRENLGNPRPGLLYKLWRASHPPLGERIDFCNGYRPWETGAPLEYAPLFRAPAQP
jgi:Zn-dependent protease with chaperone function